MSDYYICNVWILVNVRHVNFLMIFHRHMCMHVNARCEACVMFTNMHEHKTKVSYVSGYQSLNYLSSDVKVGVHVDKTHVQ